MKVEPSINVFFGENAQGKTNIIEAIYLCACARSHRTSKDKELIFHGENGYRVEIDLMAHRFRPLFLCRENEEVLSGDRIYLTQEKKEQIRKENYYEESLALSFSEASDGPEGIKRARRIAEHDHVPLERISDFMGIFHAVIFAPEDLLLIKEGPSVRRRYMDLLISQVRPCYFHDLLTYSKLLQQRNKTLKMLRQRQGIHTLSLAEESEIEIWDYPLAEAAARLLSERIHFSKKIKEIAGEKHEQISGGRESLFIKYKTVTGLLTEEIMADPDLHLDRMAKYLVDKWRESHQDDYEKGNTSVGPQKDDLELSLDGDGLRAFASQGQQRSAALALKLAELKILRDETGEMPVLLLDDVFSELDAGRRTCLLSNLADAQVFITCTDKALIEKELFEMTGIIEPGRGKPEITFYEVSEGTVERVKSE